MTTGYVICDYAHIKDAFPEFKSTMEVLKTSLVEKSRAEWRPLEFGGLKPKSGQFGESTIMPELFANGAGAMLQTWNNRTTVQGHQLLMQGVNIPNLPEDYKVGLIGIAFLDKSQKITEIRMDVSDKRLPRLNIEEMHAYDEPTVIFENGYILDEETGFQLWGFAESIGFTRIKLLGIELNRIPNKLQVTQTGAALL